MIDSAREMGKTLDQNYVVEADATKECAACNFLKFKMVDFKIISS